MMRTIPAGTARIISYVFVLTVSLPDTPSEVYKVLRQFGHTEFREGQEEIIMRMLCGQYALLSNILYSCACLTSV